MILGHLDEGTYIREVLQVLRSRKVSERYRVEALEKLRSGKTQSELGGSGVVLLNSANESSSINLTSTL